MIRRILLLSAAMLPLFGSIRAWAQTPPAGADETMEIESQVPGETQIVRWDALLNQGGADAVNKVGAPAKTDSKIYQAMTCNGFEIRSAIADALTNGGVEQLGQNMDFGQTFNNGNNGQTQFNNLQPLNFNYFNSPARNGIRMNGFFQGDNGRMMNTVAPAPAGALHLHLDNTNLVNGQIIENNRNTKIDVAPTLEFDGILAPGDAVALMAPFTAPSKKVYYQLAVWETFKAQPQLMEMMRNQRDAQWWIQNGPGKLRKAASLAVIWNSQAKHSAHDAPAEFVKTLDDGKTVRLIALGRPDQYPFCWWDGKGNPVSGLQNPQAMFARGNGLSLQAIVELHSTPEEMRRISPATQPVAAGQANGQFGNNFAMNQVVNDQQMSTAIADGTSQIEVGVIVGDWNEIGQLNVGEDKVIDGVTYKVTVPNLVNRGINPQGVAQRFALNLTQSQYNDDLLQMSPVGPDGREAASMTNFNQLLNFGHGPGPRFVGYQFAGFAPEDIKYVRLCQRKRQYITFDGFATQPAAAMKTDFTPEELTAALNVAADQQQRVRVTQIEESQMRPQNFRSQIESMQDNPNTAPGTLHMLIIAAQTGAEKTVRQILTPPNDAADPGLDALAHLFTVSTSNFVRASSHFNDGEMLALKLSGVPLEDLSAMFTRINWTRNDDGSWSAGTLATLAKGSTTQSYYLDFRPMLAGKDALAITQKKSAVQDRIAKALDQPGVTVDQVRAAAAE